MQYFLKELWLRMNECNESIRIDAEEQWNDNSLRYERRFELIKKHLPRAFVKEFMRRNGLHDYQISCIAFVKEKKGYSCQMRLSHNSETVLLNMNAIKNIRFDLENLYSALMDTLTWGYAEFDISPERHIKLTILCDPYNEMQFEFGSIKLVVSDKPMP